ncbi:MAG: LysM peptidoglycan-binding domain-containing protein [Anaerolineae bacterium]|nr:LysM peptidoglycan-binding domain-containing protein [Anaerolineae bacterium]
MATRFKAYPRYTPSVPTRVRKMIAYVWILGAMALPLAGVTAIVQGVSTLPLGDDQPTYQVKSGDSLSLIALRYGVTVDELVQTNGLSNPDMIYIGQVLVIPNQQPQVSEISGVSGQIYTIQAGESLAMIAQRYGVSTDQILAANNLPNVNSIYAGQQLTIPDPVATPAEKQEGVAYTLQRGDSLYRVSLVYGVMVDDLLAANSLSNPNAIYPGLIVRIPISGEPDAVVAPDVIPAETAENTGGRTYTVKMGDTLSHIAVNYSVTVDGIVAANGLSRADRIYIGQTLNIPEAGATARPYPAQAAVSHRVKSGETLSEIALRYGVNIHTLAVANGIQNPARIYIGMILSIPSAQTGSNSVRYASVGEGVCSNVELSQTGTGYFIRPTRGYIVSQRFLPWHAGIDLATDTGMDVYAADGGTVVFSGWNSAGYGNLVILDHNNGWRTYYGHLSKIEVACNQWIPRGSIIGEVGSTGNSTGPHLHFEMLRFGISVNPEGYIRF